MIAANIMNTEVLAIPASGSISGALRLMRDGDIRQLAVLDNEKRLTGIITHSAVMNALLPECVREGMAGDAGFKPESHGLVEDIEGAGLTDLLDKEFLSVTPETKAKDVAALIVNANTRIESVFVVDDKGILLGMISPLDMFKRLWKYSGKK